MFITKNYVIIKKSKKSKHKKLQQCVPITVTTECMFSPFMDGITIPIIGTRNTEQGDIVYFSQNIQQADAANAYPYCTHVRSVIDNAVFGNIAQLGNNICYV